jgi:hypothetical protein
MNLSTRDRRAILIGGIGLAAVLLFNVLLLPWINDWLAARDQIAASRTELTDLEQQLRVLVRLHDRLDDVYAGGGSQPLIRADDAQVRGPEIIRKVLTQGGLGVQNIKSLPVSQVRPVEDGVLVPFEAQGGCRVEQLVQFLSQMSKAEAILIIERLNVVNAAQDPGNLTINITLSMLAQQEKKSR